MSRVGPRIARQIGVPMLAVCAIHTGTHERTAVFQVRGGQADARLAERPVIVLVYHGRVCRARTLMYGWVRSDQVERHRKTGEGAVTIRRAVQVLPTVSAEEAALGREAPVSAGPIGAVSLRSVCKLVVCTEQATALWEERKQRFVLQRELSGFRPAEQRSY